MNIEQVRFNMIEQQIRPWDVLNPVVLDLLVRVKREDFVPAQYSTLAFVDMEIPLGHGEAMMSPKLEARILQEVNVKPGETVLEIGTGSGYLTALLSHLAKRVYSVDIVSDFKMQAHATLAAHGIKNVTLETGDAAKGWSKHGKYDVIIVTGSLPVLPDSMLNDLNIGGRLFAITGDAPAMSAQLITCVGEGEYNTVTLFETVIKPLQNAVQPERFVF